MLTVTTPLRLPMDFADRLAALRKEKGFTQQALADRIQGSVVQIHRYEAGTSQPTLDVIRKLALSLGVSTDELIFGKNGRGPDDELRLQFEALAQFNPEEKQVVKELLDSLILKHQARKWAPARQAPARAGKATRRRR